MTYQVRVFMKPVCTVLRLGKPEGEAKAEDGVVQGMSGEAAR